MKKILSTILAFMLVVSGTCLFSGCSKKTENYSLANISSNGGLGVISNGYLYYIAGGTDDFEDIEPEALDAASIYRKPVDENLNPTTDTGELIYKGIAGFKYGELYAFGDHIYFSTPSQKKSNAANTMTDRTSFCRMDLDGDNVKVLYTTETASELKYEYYCASDTALYLVVNEGTELYSVKIGKKCKKTVISEDVTSVVFTSTNGRGNGAEQFVYYTEAPKETYLTQRGSMVYKIDPSGENKAQISSGKDVSLISINHGYLYYAMDKIVYRSTGQTALDKVNVISYKHYDVMYFFEDGGFVAADEDSNKLIYTRWKDGVLIDSHTVTDSKDHTIILDHDGYIYTYTTSYKLTKLDVSKTNEKAEEITKLTILNVGEQLKQEKIGDRLYFYTELKTTNADGIEISTWNISSVEID